MKLAAAIAGQRTQCQYWLNAVHTHAPSTKDLPVMQAVAAGADQDSTAWRDVIAQDWSEPGIVPGDEWGYHILDHEIMQRILLRNWSDFELLPQGKLSWPTVLPNTTKRCGVVCGQFQTLCGIRKRLM